MPILTREETAKYIRELRPNLSPKTISSYISLLFPVYREDYPDSKTIDTKWFETSQERIIEILRERPETSKVSILAAISVIINDSLKTELIRSQMFVAAKEVQKDYDAGEMNEKQRENWIDYPNIVKLWNKMKTDADHFLNKEDPLNKKQITFLNEFILFTLSAGIYFPPRRLEWIHVKISRFDVDKNNYIDFVNNLFVLNDYKTQNKYGQRSLLIPDELMTILKLFIERTKPEEYLLTNTQGNPYSQARAVQILNTIMGKNIGVSMLRHIYKSHFFSGVPSLKEMKDNASAMGHSLPISIQYIRK